MYDQEVTKSRCGTIIIKENRIQYRLNNRFETLQELDDIDTISEIITDIIQQCASRVAKAINMPQKLRISSLT